MLFLLKEKIGIGVFMYFTKLVGMSDRDRPIHLKPILTDTDFKRFWNF